MPRATPRQLRIAAIVSAVLCALTLALWVRSYWTEDHLGRLRYRVLPSDRPGGRALVQRIGLFSAQGQLALCDGSDEDLAPAAPTPQNTRPEGETHYGWFTGPRYTFSGWYGERDEDFFFGFGHNSQGNPGPWDHAHYRVFSIPHAFIAAIFAVLPVWWALGRRRQRVLAVTYAGFVAVGTLSMAAPGFALLFIIVGTIISMARMIYVIDQRFFAPRLRRRTGFCAHCKYDLTGNVSGICPECGTPIARPAPTA